jgi:hypothetical protein
MAKEKIKEWFHRYFFIEIFATFFAIVGGNISQLIFNNIIISSYIATWSDNIIYYSLMSYRDLKARKKKDRKITIFGFFKVFRNIIAEFGPAEYLDSFLIRPFFMATALILISSASIAFLIGSVAANIIFYIPVIISYELRKKLFKD